MKKHFLFLLPSLMLWMHIAGPASAVWPEREGYELASQIYQDAQEFTAKGTGAPAGDIRRSVLLNEEWHYQQVFPDGSLGGWKTELVPKSWNSGGGNHVRWYAHKFYCSTAYAGKQMRIRFHAVSLYAAVFLNGQLVGEHAGQYTPFECDVSGIIQAGQDNILTVYNKDQTYAVDGDKHYHQISSSPLNLPPNSTTARTGNGGIWQDVELIVHGPVSADDIFVQTSVRQSLLTLSYVLNNRSDSARTVTVSHSIGEWENQGVIALTISPVQHTIPANDTLMVTTTIPWLPSKLWSPEHPNLYVLQTNVTLADGSESDRPITRFGFREFWIDGPDFRLNGTKIRLRGESQIPGHSSSQPVQRREALEVLLRACKDEFGVNAMRVHAAIGVPDIFNVADEVGLLLIDQSSIWSRGNAFYTRGVEQFLPNTQREFREWITRDRNHPSVVIWSAENEMIRSGHSSMSWVLQLDDYITAWDPTRPVEHDGAAFGAGYMHIYHVHHQENYSDVMNAWKARFDKPMIMGEWWIGGNSGERRLTTGQDVRDWDDWVGKSLPLWLDRMEEQRIQGTTGVMPFNWSRTGDPVVFEDVLDKAPSLTWSAARTSTGVKPAVGLTWLNPGWVAGERSYKLNAQKAAPFRRGLGALFAGIVERQHTGVGGDVLQRTLAVCNDSETARAFNLQWSLLHNGAPIESGNQTVSVASGEQERLQMTLHPPDVAHTTCISVRVTLFEESVGQEVVASRDYALTIYPESLIVTPALHSKIGVYDPSGTTAPALQAGGLPITMLPSLTVPDSIGILIIGEKSLAGNSVSLLTAFVEHGGRVLLLQQGETVTALPVDFGFAETSVVDDFPAYQGFDFGGQDKIINYSDYVPVLTPEHPVFRDMPDSLFSFWQFGDNRLADDIFVKPTASDKAVANNVRVLAGGARREYASIVECPYGQGTYLATQLHLMDNYRIDPEATVLLHNMFRYLDGQRGRFVPKSALIVGETTGATLRQEVGARVQVVQNILAVPDSVQSVIIGSEVQEAGINWDALNNFLWNGGSIFCFPRAVPSLVAGRVTITAATANENFLSVVRPGKILSGYNSFDSENWSGVLVDQVFAIADTTGLAGEITAGVLNPLTGQSNGYDWDAMKVSGAAMVEYRIGGGRLVLSQLAMPAASNPQSQFIYAAILTNLGVALNVDFPTGIDDGQGINLLPLDFVLEQNYPNPFNTSTTIRYALPRMTHLRLVVYNLLGQRVRVLVDNEQPKGTYSVEWDGRNDKGITMGSGTYLFRLETQNYSTVHKMLLLR